MNLPQHLSLSNEHYTPPYIIEAARKTMGSIDLDPASCLLANTVVKANTIFTKDNSGLDNCWHGNVFLNPPGGTVNGKSNQQIWLEYAVNEFMSGRVEQLVFLSFNLESLRTCGSYLTGNSVCIPNKRIRYYSEYSAGVLREGNWNKKGEWSNSPACASAIYYFGGNASEFSQHFSSIGAVWRLNEF